ncbi:type II toxin-antitoxin system VapC family toxin [Enterovirga sp. CN4-39]|uniref:type II toxin-antitoxin system VapC family toxin n=1 Tax=Enterovirga sp. CN4-39 TaxID=3400910 RepID=UPI003C0D022B
MIVVDTSAVLSIMLEEPEADDVRRALLRASSRCMSAGNYLECAMVMAGRRLGGRADLDEWLALRRIDLMAVDRDLAVLGADAFIRFGKGRHPAGLNYGDCFAYALARHLRAPLLFKGGDFARTDIEPALV